MKIDEARRYRKAIGIDDPICACVDPSRFNDAALFDRDVPEKRRQTAAIVNSPALDQNIVRHEKIPPSFR
jgi:hypothetical protein